MENPTGRTAIVENFRYSDEAPLSERRAELAAYLRRGVGKADGSLVFLSASAASDLAELLEADDAAARGADVVKLPLCADGTPLRPGERVWTSGGEGPLYVAFVDVRRVALEDLSAPGAPLRVERADGLTRERPDGWARIADELRGGPCRHFTGADGGGSCTDCPGPGLSRADCWQVFAGKLADRVRELAGAGR